MKEFCRPLVAVLLFAAAASAQNVSSSVRGVLIDPAGAVIPRAICTLTNEATGTVATAVSWEDGVFTFPNISRGAYTLKVKADGFKLLSIGAIPVSSGETHALGRLALELGETREVINVQTEPASIQLASGERSGLVTGPQLNDLALKGRDFFALLQTIPGVVDTKGAREATGTGSNAGIFINGARDNQKNFSVDGMVDHDTHSNQSMPFMPNMDAIAEIRILTSNYQAEYGRNSGGTVSLITKSGTRELHGSAYYFYRHEDLNANNFFNNRTGTPKLPYRYRIGGYSIGGPVYIPRVFNTAKEKLFFFWSQEYTNLKQDFGTRFVNTPTALERAGDYSRSFDVNGALIPVTDPLTGRAFPGNIIPKDRISPAGQSILNFYPLPNYVDSDPRNLYRWNHRTAFSDGVPRRNDVLRMDTNLSPSLRVAYRFVNDNNNQLRAGLGNYHLTPLTYDWYGRGSLVRVTKTFSPSLVNEFSFGKTTVSRDYDFREKELVARTRMGNPAQWFQDTNAPDYIPNVNFGGQPANPINANLGAVIPNRYRNYVYVITNDTTKIVGPHTFKAGISVERTQAEFPIGGSFRGTFNFGRDTNNPFDSGDSFSNALLGYFSSYTEAQKLFTAQQRYWSAEWYVQDNWRVGRRLTLDFGLRFCHIPPIEDLDRTASTFDPSLFDPKKVPLLYAPAKDATGRRVAIDPRTGALAIAPLIGQYVPGTGEPANGMAIGGINGYPKALITRPWVSFGPRFGFAYDLFGNGNTALRGGWGWFYDTSQSNPSANTIGNPPLSYSPTLSYGTLDTYALGGGAIGPSSMSLLFGRHKSPDTMNFSLGIQHRVLGMVVDTAYVGGLSRHLYLRRDLNPIPIYSHFDPRNEDPTQPGRPLPDNFFRVYPGQGSLNVTENVGSSNYNALQISVNRRFTRGVQFGLAYTFSKALGVANTDTDLISPYFAPRLWNYGPLSFDRSQTLVFNYMFDVPKLGRRVGWKPAGWVLDNWQVSGITSFISGSPFTPAFSTVDGADITGSAEGARITVAGDPRLDKGQRDFYRNFNTDVFRRTPLRGFGNAGVGILRGPGINNWDFNVSKRVPLFSEARFLQFRTELFNAWNHTQFDGLSTAARFDTAGKQVDPNFGAYSSARAARTIQLSLKVIF